jgi:hypothetical protein
MSSRFTEAFNLQTTTGNDGFTPSGTQADGTLVVAAATNFAPVFCKDLDAASIQFTTLGASTLVGILTLQASNDRSNLEQTGRPDAGSTTNCAQATSKAVASGAASLYVVLPGANLAVVYRWIRLVFAFTSGSGNVKASMQQKGWP